MFACITHSHDTILLHAQGPPLKLLLVYTEMGTWALQGTM